MKRIDHIGIAVHSIEKALLFYRDTLGLSLERIGEVPDEGVRVAILPIGQTRIELLEPLDEKSPLTRFLMKRGEGIHHIAFQTKNIEETAHRFEACGVGLLGKPRLGAGGARITFVHPKSAHGVLIELCQSDPPLPHEPL